MDKALKELPGVLQGLDPSNDAQARKKAIAALASSLAQEKCPRCGKRRKLKATEVKRVPETCTEDGYLIRDLSCGHCG